MIADATLPPADLFDAELPPQPYPGLRPFEKEEWPIFFGRELITGEVIERLIAKQFLTLHGDSGCGKSSLIRAGVMPRLERDHARGGATWRVTTMLPRNAPLRNLATALAQLEGATPNSERVTDLRRLLNRGTEAAEHLVAKLRRGKNDHICLLVDQFEEVFHFAAQGGTAEAQLFIAVLVGLQQKPPPGMHTALTMRSEFVGACARYDGLADAFNATQYLLPRMDASALLRAIGEPARLYGGEVERELAEAIIADSGRGQDQLPLMQHALMLLRQRQCEREGNTGPDQRWVLTLKAYRDEGSVAQLLSDHANEVVKQLAERSVDRDKTLRNVERCFKALTTINADGHAIRRPRTIAQLISVTGGSKSELLDVLEPLCADGVSFLKIFGRRPYGDTELVDISHEALIRNWKTLSRWISEERDFLNWLVEVKRDEEDWRSATSAQKSDNMLMGKRLDVARKWMATRPLDVPPHVSEYISASLSSIDLDYRKEVTLTGVAAFIGIIAVVLSVRGISNIFGIDWSRLADRFDLWATASFGYYKGIVVAGSFVIIALSVLYCLGWFLNRYQLIAKGEKYGDVEERTVSK